MSKYDLTKAQDSNAFNIMGYVTNALRREGLRDKIREYQDKATKSDYDNLLVESMEYLELANEKAIENGYEEEEEDEDY